MRAVIGKGDLPGAEAVATAYRNEKGVTPEFLEAFSWLGRGALAAKKLDEARPTRCTPTTCDEALKTRKLDDEPRLPIALGAAIEVQALALAGQGNRSEAVYFLREEAEQYKGTSIIMRLNKNINLLSLEGQPAFEVASSESLAHRSRRSPAQRQAGRGVPVGALVRRLQDAGPVPRRVRDNYTSSGITVVAPTQRFGYVE